MALAPKTASGRARPELPWPERGHALDFDLAPQPLYLGDHFLLGGILLDPSAQPVHAAGAKAGVGGGLRVRFVQPDEVFGRAAPVRMCRQSTVEIRPLDVLD